MYSLAFGKERCVATLRVAFFGAFSMNALFCIGVFFMKKITIIFTCFILLFSLTGCNFGKQDEQGENNSPTGFVASVDILGEKQYSGSSDFPVIVVDGIKTYEYQVNIAGYMIPEATYNVSIQIGFYSDGKHIKNTEKNYTYYGREHSSKHHVVNFETSQCVNRQITAKVLKISWS